MTYALARTTQLKVGTGVAVLPGRHPVLVAKQLATLAGLAPRRVLPVFGLRPARPAELAAFPIPRGAARASPDCAGARPLVRQVQAGVGDEAGECYPLVDVFVAEGRGRFPERQ